MKTNNLSLKAYILQLCYQYKVYIISLIAVAIGAGIFEISVDYKIKEIIDAISSDRKADLGYFLAVFVFYKFMHHGLYFVNRLLDIIYKPKLLEQTLLDMYTKTIRHSLHWFDSHLSGEISNKVFDFQSSLKDVANHLFASINSIATMCIMMLFLFKVHPLSVLVFMAFVVVYVPIMYLLLKKQMVIGESSVKARQRTVGIVNDSISNIFCIKVIGSPFLELTSKVRPAIAHWKEWDKKTREFDAYFVDNADTVLSVAMGAAQIYLVAYLFQRGDITAGGFAFISMMILKIHWKLSTLIETILFNINPAIASVKSSYEFVSSKLDVEDRSGAYALRCVRGHITYSDVNFVYGKDKKHVLYNFNLDIKSGEQIGIVGMSGAGKTTLMKCLLRYFDIDSGSISIDGNDIRDITQQSLRDAISIIPQDITMFHRSIQENLRLAKYNATDEELIAACKKANIHQDIMQMQEGYDTIVGERGVKLSGGQRQRVAIARAILKDAPILILDEATSSLDTATEQLIQNAINEVLETSKATVIAIAHRLSTIKHMDRIIVLDNGKIVEEGDHNSLIKKKGGFYKKLWEMQAI